MPSGARSPRHVILRWPAAIAATLTFGAASEAHAAGLTLTWSAPPGCPDGARAERDIAALVGRPLDTGDPVVARATLSQVETGWLAIVTMAARGQAANERRVEGRTCREVADATTAIIALALVSPGEPDATPPPPPPTPRPKVAPTPPATSPPEATPIFGGGAGVVGGVDFAALPRPALGFGAWGALFFFQVNRIELRVAGWLPRLETLDEGGAEMSLVAGTLRYCRTLAGDSAAFELCGGLEAGAMIGTGTGFDQNETGVGRWIAPELAALLAVHPVQALDLRLELEGLVPITRDAFTVDAERIYRPGPVDARLLLGLGFHAP